MSLRWLSSTVGAKFRPGIRRKMAPLAQRDLAAEIDADALTVHRVWARDLVLDPVEGAEPEKTVVAWIDTGGRADVVAWLASAVPDGALTDEQPEVRTDWLFFPAAPEAILIGVVGGPGESFRFNLRFAADPYRRQLKALARTGLLGLTSESLQMGPERQLETPCVFVPVQTRPLRTFLRELPAPPVV